MKYPPLIAILLFISCFRVSGQVKDSVSYKNLEPYDFHLTWLRAEKAMIIDVREPFEYRRNRIRDAVNLPSSARLLAATDTLDKETVLLFYCSTDYRSKRAAEMMAERGFTNAVNLDGGIVAWKRDGFPVDKKRPKAH
jgi:rhodanese-related sulfurtransferase